jgi:uncharacterized protein
MSSGRTKRFAWPASLLAVLAAGGFALAQGHHGGRGTRGAGGHGAGMMDRDHHADMQVFHYLFSHRADIRRTVRSIAGGVETLTESDDPQVAAKIRVHVDAMYKRMKESRPIHTRDPLFLELFRHADKIDMKVESTAKGLKVKETSADPYVADLIRSHAQVVSAFLENGHGEMMKGHPLPAAR